jgi:hypothetical protein
MTGLGAGVVDVASPVSTVELPMAHATSRRHDRPVADYILGWRPAEKAGINVLQRSGLFDVGSPVEPNLDREFTKVVRFWAPRRWLTTETMDVDGMVAEIEEVVRTKGLVAYDGRAVACVEADDALHRPVAHHPSRRADRPGRSRAGRRADPRSVAGTGRASPGKAAGPEHLTSVFGVGSSSKSGAWSANWAAAHIRALSREVLTAVDAIID